MTKQPTERISVMLLDAGAMEIRKVPGHLNNEDVDTLPLESQPFLYSSGNWGPGYVSIKNLVGRKTIIKSLCLELSQRVADEAGRIDFVAGNVTGGVIPGWQLSEELARLMGRTVPFVYIRGTRKRGGQKELITGITNNPEIPQKSNGLVVEELVNFAEATCTGARALRDAGYSVAYAACVLFYRNPEALKALEEERVQLVHLLTLPDLLEVAREHRSFPRETIADYQCFLADPLAWQRNRGLKPVTSLADGLHGSESNRS